MSFFGPFYGGYHVIALDQKDYRWAMAVGPDRDYLVDSGPRPPAGSGCRQQLLRQARELGFDVASLIWVEQTRDDG